MTKKIKKFNPALLPLLVFLLIPLPGCAGDARENLQRLHLPDGFTIEIFADNVPGARSLTRDPDTGTIYVSTRDKDKVYAVADTNQDHRADVAQIILNGMHVPNGIAFHEGMLYVAKQDRIVRYPVAGYRPDQPFTAREEVIYDRLPDKGHHGWRYLAVGPDGKLYVTVGVACNICDFEDPQGTILRMDPDGSNVEKFAGGQRNSVGLAFHPTTGVLYFTDNNTDMMGDDIPPGELNAAPSAGMHFGFPYYAGGHIRHEDWKDRTPPQQVTYPVVEFDAHSAPLGVEFYTGNMFPASYKNDALVAHHGSWNRSEPIGYRIMHVNMDEAGKVIDVQVFIDGWLVDGHAWGRPVDLLQLPDGSVLISDDYQGVLYRVSYKK